MFNTVPVILRYPFFCNNVNSSNNIVCILCNTYIDVKFPNKHTCSCRNTNTSVKVNSTNLNNKNNRNVYMRM